MSRFPSHYYAYSPPLGSLTTLKAHVSKVSEPLCLISHFSQLEVLGMGHVFVPLCQADFGFPSPPFLHQGHSHRVMNGWSDLPWVTAGPITSPYLASLLHKALHSEGRSMCLLQMFQIPVIDSLTAKTKEWRPGNGTQRL